MGAVMNVTKLAGYLNSRAQGMEHGESRSLAECLELTLERIDELEFYNQMLIDFVANSQSEPVESTPDDELQDTKTERKA